MKLQGCLSENNAHGNHDEVENGSVDNYANLCFVCKICFVLFCFVCKIVFLVCVCNSQ